MAAHVMGVNHGRNLAARGRVFPVPLLLLACCACPHRAAPFCDQHCHLSALLFILVQATFGRAFPALVRTGGREGGRHSTAALSSSAAQGPLFFGSSAALLWNNRDC